MLFRIVELEISQEELLRKAKNILFIHALFIIAFSSIQFAFNVPPVSKYGGIYSPFDDVHSYGSYITFLFIFFVAFFLFDKKKFRFGLIFCGILFFLIVCSSSTTTLITAIVFGLVYLFNIIKKPFFFLIVSLILAPFIYINVNSINTENLKSPIIKRYAQRLIIKESINKLQGRYKSADQALGILKEFPLTGSGVGTFYRISRYYHFRKY